MTIKEQIEILVEYTDGNEQMALAFLLGMIACSNCKKKLEEKLADFQVEQLVY